MALICHDARIVQTVKMYLVTLVAKHCMYFRKHGVYGFMWAGMCNKRFSEVYRIKRVLLSLLHVPVS
jgi:hypothetical protein